MSEKDMSKDMDDDWDDSDGDNDLIGRTGFDRPAPNEDSAEKRRALTLIATAALAISTAVAATVVSIGMARADIVGRAADSDGGTLAIALFIAATLAGIAAVAGIGKKTGHKPISG
jgi:hypothetical protein